MRILVEKEISLRVSDFNHANVVVWTTIGTGCTSNANVIIDKDISLE
jgi:hypothetical protein